MAPTARTKTVASLPEDSADIVAEAARILQPETIDGVYIGFDGKPLSLYGRLAKIIGGLPEVKPEGRNQHFNYGFVTDKQVLGLVRPRLSQQRIVIYPEIVEEQPFVELTTAKGGRSMLTRLHVVFRVVDGLTGESFTGEAMGYGDDSGDKGANKAYTAALKNFLIKLFLLGGADRDIEDDAETDLRAQARGAGIEPVRQVSIEETIVEPVARGGRSASATKAQVDQVSRLVAALEIKEPQWVGTLIEQTQGVPNDITSWAQVRPALEALTGEQIGHIIEAMTMIGQQVPDDSGY